MILSMKNAKCSGWLASLCIKASAHVWLQASGKVSHLEAQVASLQQSLLKAKHLVHVKLQDAVAGHRQANKTVQVEQRRLCLSPIDHCSDLHGVVAPAMSMRRTTPYVLIWQQSQVMHRLTEPIQALQTCITSAHPACLDSLLG